MLCIFSVAEVMMGFDNHTGHFMASIKIKPHGPEPDRRSKPAWNGMRWGFKYAEDVEKFGEQAGVYDVFPEFLDENGNSIKNDVPCTGKLNAVMHALSPELHFPRIKIGTKFYHYDGRFIVAVGIVTKLSVDDNRERNGFSF